MRKIPRVGVIGFVAICGSLWGADEAPVERYPVLQGGKWGYMDRAGKVVIKPEYDMAWDFSEGLASVQVGLKRGYLDAQGNMVIKPQFDMTRPFSEGVAAVLTGVGPIANVILFNYGSGEWAYIDKTGKPAFAIKGISGKITAYAGEFHEGRAAVGVKQGWYKETRGEFLSKNGMVGTGNGSVRIESSWVGRYSGGLAPFEQIRDKGKFGYVNANGVVVLERIYEGAGNFSDGLAPVAVGIDVNDPSRTSTWTKAGRYTLGARNGADRAWGTPSIPMDEGDAVSFGATKTFTFTVTAPAKEGKYNFQWQMQAGRGFGELSPNVEVAVSQKPIEPEAAPAPPKDAASPAISAAPSTGPVPGKRLEDGARFVSQQIPAAMTVGQKYTVSVTMKNSGPTEPKWGFIDPSGKLAIEPQFQAAREFSSGMAAVCIAKKWGYADKTGKLVISPQYDFANPFSEGLARVVVDGKHGFIDSAGKMVIEPRFDYGWDFSRGLARVAVGDKEGYVDKTGKYVWEPKESVFGPEKTAIHPEPTASK